jgi:hypothetical protein
LHLKGAWLTYQAMKLMKHVEYSHDHRAMVDVQARYVDIFRLQLNSLD